MYSNIANIMLVVVEAIKRFNQKPKDLMKFRDSSENHSETLTHHTLSEPLHRLAAEGTLKHPQTFCHQQALLRVTGTTDTKYL